MIETGKAGSGAGVEDIERDIVEERGERGGPTEAGAIEDEDVAGATGNGGVNEACRSGVAMVLPEGEAV